MALEQCMWKLLDARGAKYPPNTMSAISIKPSRRADFYREPNSCNAFNPGIGQTSSRHWGGQVADSNETTVQRESAHG